MSASSIASASSNTEDQVSPQAPTQDIAIDQGEHHDVKARRTTSGKGVPQFIQDLSDDEKNGSEISASVAGETAEISPLINAPPDEPSAFAPLAHDPKTGGKKVPLSYFNRSPLVIKQLMTAGKEEIVDNLRDAGLDTDGTKKDVQARLMLHFIGLDVDRLHKRCKELFETNYTMQHLRDQLKFLGLEYKGKEKPDLIRRVLQAEDRQGISPDDKDDRSSPSAKDSEQDGSAFPIGHTQREQSLGSSPIEPTAANKTQKRKSDEIADFSDDEASPTRRRKAKESTRSGFQSSVNGDAGGSDSLNPPSSAAHPIKPLKRKIFQDANASAPTAYSQDISCAKTSSDPPGNGTSQPAPISKKPTSTSKKPQKAKVMKSNPPKPKRKDEIGNDFFVMGENDLDTRIFFERTKPPPEVFNALFHVLFGLTGFDREHDTGVVHAYRIRLPNYRAYIRNPGVKDFRHQKWLNMQRFYQSCLPG